MLESDSSWLVRFYQKMHVVPFSLGIPSSQMCIFSQKVNTIRDKTDFLDLAVDEFSVTWRLLTFRG